MHYERRTRHLACVFAQVINQAQLSVSNVELLAHLTSDLGISQDIFRSRLAELDVVENS
jgi:hypothetical protein